MLFCRPGFQKTSNLGPGKSKMVQQIGSLNHFAFSRPGKKQIGSLSLLLSQASLLRLPICFFRAREKAKWSRLSICFFPGWEKAKWSRLPTKPFSFWCVFGWAQPSMNKRRLSQASLLRLPICFFPAREKAKWSRLSICFFPGWEKAKWSRLPTKPF